MGFRRPENPSLSEETEALIDPEYYANHEEVDSLGEKSHYKRSRWSHFLDLKLLTYTKLGNPRPFSIQSLFRFIVQYSISTIIFLMPSFVTSIPQLFRSVSFSLLSFAVCYGAGEPMKLLIGDNWQNGIAPPPYKFPMNNS